MTKPLSDHLDAFREKRLVEQEQARPFRATSNRPKSILKNRSIDMVSPI